uniref:Uncharacterized protein n=1 Tax=Mus musculus TaxID=10090 RepID=Q6R5D5_MOUSE|nr:unknown [Mus musculus]
MGEALDDINAQDSRMNRGTCSFLEGKLLCCFNSCEPLSSCGAGALTCYPGLRQSQALC